MTINMSQNANEPMDKPNPILERSLNPLASSLSPIMLVTRPTIEPMIIKGQKPNAPKTTEIVDNAFPWLLWLYGV